MEPTQNIIDQILQKFRGLIGDHFQLYRNHACRVYLNCLMLDIDSSNEFKYAIAAAFHDIGIWTANNFDYLAPSIAAAKTYLEQMGQQQYFEEIKMMIYWHHKRSSYTGDHANTVETFRKADWIDVTFGWKNYGLEKQKIKNNLQAYPELGFHFFLVKKATMYFFKHPLHPLPMFKK